MSSPPVSAWTRWVAEYEADHDDYRAILAKALADRLAEAFAERLHQRVRTEWWGYSPEEQLDNDALVREQYAGIRPAPGYPAQPDHTEKETLFELLGATEALGVTLTESLAMVPTASVCGIYLGHPEASYFNLGTLARDQVVDYAHRKNQPLEEIERWLSPVLGYDPARHAAARSAAEVGEEPAQEPSGDGAVQTLANLD